VNDRDSAPPVREESHGATAGPAIPPGRRPLTAGLVQRRASGSAASRVEARGAAPASADADVPPAPVEGGLGEAFSFGPAGVQATAERGVAGPGSALPFADRIQAAFGDHDVGQVTAHTGDDASAACDELGAHAYATGRDVAFAGPPDLHTAAHEAAHVVQQRAGVQLAGGVGQAGDEHEQEADAAADRVVAGMSAAPVLARYAAGGATSRGQVQRDEREDGAAAGEPAVDPPTPGDGRVGFIDNDQGANIRNRPGELAGSRTLTPTPLRPATRVFVSGRHPQTADWWYVTAYLSDSIVRGYVQGLRVVTDLPEPTARLYQIQAGDTAERLAVREFSSAVRDGQDLRFYENVLLYVNRRAGRAGVVGSYQDPGVLGGGANNVHLVADRRIWLVSPEYARTLHDAVPDGSLTDGAVASVRRFAGHIEDIIASVTTSPGHLDEVAGEYAQAIRDHMAEIVGVIAGFVAAEALSAFLASTPTGVGQIVAVMIQLTLALLGAAGMATAIVGAVQHADRWLRQAWTANGNPARIAEASRNFLRMLVDIAMAVLAYLGVRGNTARAAAITSSMPTALPALAVVGGGRLPGAGAGTAVATGVPGPAGPLGTAVAMSQHGDEGGGSQPEVVIEGTADAAHEAAQATRFGRAEGGGTFRFLGNSSQGIEGFFRRLGQTLDIPVSLKDFTGTGRLRNIIGRINVNAAQVTSAGHAGRTVLHARVAATAEEMMAFARSGPLARMPQEGVFQRMIFECSDGIVEVSATGIVRR
jgi:hypothetical protein